MVVMTAKVSKKKLLLTLIVLASLIVLLAFCLRERSESSGETADARAAFLSSFGYQVTGAPVEQQTLRIPTEPSEVFDRYNQLQKSQGYDLSALAGQEVERYVYQLKDYDDTGALWYATVLEHQGKIAGGDVAGADGTMHGFTRPKQPQASQS